LQGIIVSDLFLFCLQIKSLKGNENLKESVPSIDQALSREQASWREIKQHQAN